MENRQGEAAPRGTDRPGPGGPGLFAEDAPPDAGFWPGLEEFRRAAHEALEETFGFDRFREGQEQALEAVARREDCLVIMPTGSGKSLCYQVPSLILPGVTLVISPLIALMKDQVDALLLRGVAATFINSSLSVHEQWERLEGMRRRAYDLVYVAPERFRNRAFRRSLADLEVSLLAVDEAHCISQWGHDFRPDYRRLREVRELLRGVPALALTATATREVQDDIVRELEMSSPRRIVTGFDRPNLAYRVRRVKSEAAKREALEEMLRALAERSDGDAPPSGIVYTGTRRQAEEVAAFLSALDVPGSESLEGPLCRAYHAGLEDSERREVQEDFMEGRLPWVAATNAFGMGVDKSDIRCVIHYSLPGSIEAYYQEVGRAGRDGLPAACVLLFSEGDRRLQEFFIEGSNPSRRTIEAVYDFLWSLEENPIFRSLVELESRMEASGALDEKVNPLGFRAAVAILERSGALERLDHYDNLAEIGPAPGSDWKANPYSERAAVRHKLWAAVARVFERTDGEPASLQLENWARDLEMPYDSLRQGLVQLIQDDRIVFIPPFRGRAVRLPPRRRPLEEVGVDFAALDARRRRDEARLDQILAFARSRECRRNRILRHFGEAVPGPTCERCDRCARDGESPERRAPRRALGSQEAVTARKVLSGVARARGRCGRGRIIQMLLGSRSQSVYDLGLQKLSTYGLLKGFSRELLREYLDQLEEAGCICQAGDRYPVLRLTERGRRVMLDEETVELALPVLAPEQGGYRAADRQATGRGREPEPEDADVDGELFQRLRKLRREIADRLSVPAFRVFNDRTLRAMAREQPRDEDGLRRIPGVGDVTFERFGAVFLAELQRSREASDGS